MAQVALAAGAAASIIGGLKSGNDANEAKKFEAAQLEQKANESQAISQKNAALETEQAQLIRSAAAAAAGKTGTSGVGSLLDKITAEGHSRMLTELYTGNVEKRNAKIGAAVARIEGKNAKKAARIGAVTTAAKTATAIYGSAPAASKGYETAITPATSYSGPMARPANKSAFSKYWGL